MKKHYATRDFNDAGTEKRFAKGDELTGLTDGEIANYAAGGLATTEKPDTAPAAPAKPAS